MSVWIAGVAVIVGYLFGAVSFTRILGRWVLPGDDLSGLEVKLGEGTLRFNRTSASLISMKRGPAYGCLTGLLDMAKAAVPVLVFKMVFRDHDYEFLAAAAAVVGHNYPVFHRFHGGAGMSPYLGGLAVLDWVAVPVVTLLGTLTGVLMRNVWKVEKWLVDYPHRPLPMPEARYRRALARYKRFRARFPDPAVRPGYFAGREAWL